MAEKQEPEFPRVKARIVVQLGPTATEYQISLGMARLLVNRVLAQLNRARAFKK